MFSSSPVALTVDFWGGVPPMRYGAGLVLVSSAMITTDRPNLWGGGCGRQHRIILQKPKGRGKAISNRRILSQNQYVCATGR